MRLFNNQIRGRAAPVVLATCAVVGGAALTGCDSSTGTAVRTAGPGAAPRASATPEDACTRLVSAIGFAELRLVPRGKEDRQTFDGATRGQIAYVEGTIVLYGDKLPPPVRTDAEALRPTIRTLAHAEEPRAVRVKALKRFRADAAQLVTACGRRH